MTQTALDTQLLEGALAALRDGISVIPINARTKRPYGKLLPDKLDDMGQVVIDSEGKPEKTWSPIRNATRLRMRYAPGMLPARSSPLSVGRSAVGWSVSTMTTLAGACSSMPGAPTLTIWPMGCRHNYPVPEGAERDGNQKLAWLADNTQDTGRNETTIRNAHLLQAMRGQDAQRRPLSESADGEWALPHARWGKPAR